MSDFTGSTHPIDLKVGDDLTRSRLTVFFRLLLAIPHFIWVMLWTLLIELIAIVVWVIALVMGRLPDGLHNFLAAFLRYSTRLEAYILLLSNPYPTFLGDENDGYPVNVHVAAAAPQSRVKIFFRLILAIPAIVLTYVFRLVNEIVAFLGWFYCLATGRMHGGMQNISAWLLRYEVQSAGYILLLTERYPSLDGGPQL